MVYLINGEQPFQVHSDSFSVSPSSEGYTLQVSADGEDYANLFTVAANTTRMVTGISNGSYFRLLGNESEVKVNWDRECHSQGGGGSYTLPIASEATLGGVKIGSGITIDGEGKISAQGGAGGAQNYQIVSDIEEVVDPQEGTIIYYKEEAVEHNFEGKVIDLTPYYDGQSGQDEITFFTLKVAGSETEFENVFDSASRIMAFDTDGGGEFIGDNVCYQFIYCAEEGTLVYTDETSFLTEEQVVEECGEGAYTAFITRFDDDGHFHISNSQNENFIVSIKDEYAGDFSDNTFGFDEEGEKALLINKGDDDWDDLRNALDIPVASEGNLGMVQIGGGLSIDENGILSATGSEERTVLIVSVGSQWSQGQDWIIYFDADTLNQVTYSRNALVKVNFMGTDKYLVPVEYKEGEGLRCHSENFDIHLYNEDDEVKMEFNYSEDNIVRSSNENRIVKLTQSEYDALTEKPSTTIYLITE